jgi:oligopeptide/dipeptide ABC transporter ATP-binding protein
MPEALLHIQNVSNVYISQVHGVFGRKDRKPVLDRINLEMKPGEIFGLVGESGCGKTTLGKSILGLIDYEGEIRIDGLLQDRKQRQVMARKVQAVFQDPAGSLNPTKRIGWLMEEPLKIHRIGTKEERMRKVDEMLQLVGLDPSYKTRWIRELSGGQKQRICIGCALMLNPKLIIADEPVSALDVSVGAQILNLFHDLHQNLTLGLLFISHNLKVVYYLCDRIAVMYCGQIVELGTAEAIYTDPVHPYTRMLLDAVPEIKQEPRDSFVPYQEAEQEETSCCRFAARCRWKTKKCTELRQELMDIAPSGSAPHQVRCCLKGAL